MRATIAGERARDLRAREGGRQGNADAPAWRALKAAAVAFAEADAEAPLVKYEAIRFAFAEAACRWVLRLAPTQPITVPPERLAGFAWARLVRSAIVLADAVAAEEVPALASNRSRKACHRLRCHAAAWRQSRSYRPQARTIAAVLS